MLVTRTSKLFIDANPGKLEGIRYTYAQHLKYTQHWVIQLYFNRAVKSYSTEGMGQLANQAQHKARGILKAHFESVKETGMKSNIPQVKQVGCPAEIEESEDSSFDYWVSVENQFERCKKIWVPVKGHKRLREWLRRDYHLNSSCELHQDKNGKFYVIVFLQNEVQNAQPKGETLGVDVGVTHSVARSDGYLGRGCKKILETNSDRNAERRRQGHLKKSDKTLMRQILDIEALRAVRVALAHGWNLAFEDPKLLANLRSSREDCNVGQELLCESCESTGRGDGSIYCEGFPCKDISDLRSVFTLRFSKSSEIGVSMHRLWKQDTRRY